ncbi:flagellar hook-associated protein FlgK [Primorskyibacter sp. S187A]|uniref:flagellar hook-associated protein FlgK n=1 Tax=Primorskyibacter sp. S187A TaxID=3415130 RepID=UPI003C7C49D6
MSLSGALSNALSGLRASSAAARVTGSNLSNALNETFTRREIRLEQNSVTGGVRFAGVTRAANPLVLSDWRLANTRSSSAELESASTSRVFASFGLTGDVNSLETKLTEFETSLVAAATRPDLTPRLDSVAYAAKDVASKLNDIGASIQAERSNADAQIKNRVERTNTILKDIETVNERLASLRDDSESVVSLLDQRDALLDDLSSITDIRVFERDNNRIAVYSVGGASLIDGKAAVLEFEPSGQITAGMSLAAGDLKQITIAGEPMPASGSGGRFVGGELGALFDIRDKTAVTAQREVDAFAFDFAQRFNDPALDPSRGPTDLGFFTDAGVVVDAANIDGFSNRIRVNLAIDLNAGGNSQLLRDGLLSGGGGDPGNASLVQGLRDSMTTSGVISFGSFAGTSMSLVNLVSGVGSVLATSKTQSEAVLASSNAQKSVLTNVKAERGVDSSTELQRLMAIEKAYAANAQVIRTVDEMLDTLLGAV